jgi:hypothetical protein
LAPLPWDSAAADAILAEIMAEIDRGRQMFMGVLPGPLARVLDDAVAIAEGYIAGRDAESARGRDAMALLGGMPAQVRRYIANAQKLTYL